MIDDKFEMSKAGGETECSMTNIIDEKVMALLAPIKKESIGVKKVNENTEVGSGQDSIELLDGEGNLVPNIQTPEKIECVKRPSSLPIGTPEGLPIMKRLCSTERKNKYISNLSASILKIKNRKQINENAIASIKLKILEIQKQQELVKLEKTKIIMDTDIELKKVLLESAKLDLEFKQIYYMS